MRLVQIAEKGVAVPKRLGFVVLFYAVATTVLVLSLLPIEHPAVSPNDKVNHLIAYASLMVLGYVAHGRYWSVAGGVICWGVLIEILQGQTAYRMMSFADILANSAGVILGCAVIVSFLKIKQIQSTR